MISAGKGISTLLGDSGFWNLIYNPINVGYNILRAMKKFFLYIFNLVFRKFSFKFGKFAKIW